MRVEVGAFPGDKAQAWLWERQAALKGPGAPPRVGAGWLPLAG